MGWYKLNPCFYAILCLLLLATVGGMWYASRDMEELAVLKEQYETKNSQLQRLLNRSPAPTRANIETLDLNYDNLLGGFKKTQAALNLNTYDHELFFGPAPASHNDAFFMIAKYVEDARALATSSGVRAPDESRFGFSQYENVGPEGDFIERVHRQSKIMEYLLLDLFDSGISEFVSIKRESTVVGRNIGNDVFELKKGKSIQEAKSFSSLAFQLEFKGQSLSLRNFLNRLMSSSLPFSINEIEVKLDSETGSDEVRGSVLNNPFSQLDGAKRRMSAVRVPIIAENESHFVVTLEFIELVEGSIAELVRKLKKRGSRV